jgi:protein-S-isoprenylcysteine O-methyltransferase Ste14
MIPNVFLTVLFWSAAFAVVLGQAAILRSTSRAWRHTGTAVPLTERVFAWGPALVIVVVLYFAWRAATRPPMVEVQFDPTTQSITL